MITLQETTYWGPKAVNQIYILSDDRREMYGVISAGHTRPTLFTRPIRFEARGRTFKLLVRTKDIT